MPFDDRMFAIAERDLEGVLRPWPAPAPCPLATRTSLPFVVEGEAVAELVVAPAHADHLVVFLPAAERVVGRVDDDQAVLPFSDVTFQRTLRLVRPPVAVIVAQHNLIFVECRCKLRQRLHVHLLGFLEFV